MSRLTVLKKFRDERHLSQAQLGQEIGVAAETVYRWERGTRKIGLSLLPTVCEVTGLSREDLRPDVYGAG